MPISKRTGKRYKLKIVKSLSKNQVKAVKAVSRSVLRKTMETKTVGKTAENVQLFHNKPLYIGELLNTAQGVTDPNDQTTNKARIGDEILLRNLNIRFWLSNKLDRPNVMYKLYMFWYDNAVTLSDAVVYFTQSNKMLDRINNENVGIIDQKTIFSKEMYLNGTEKFEHSQLCTLNGNWKGKKIKYDDGSQTPSHKNIGVCVACYDAYGTLQTDNIASLAYNYVVRFQDP